MGNYPDGICEFCGKVFPRPNKFRTETEAFHIHGCHLKEIKLIIESGENYFNKQEIIDELNNISKLSSFGARKGNKYWKRMDECKRLKLKITSSKS